MLPDVPHAEALSRLADLRACLCAAPEAAQLAFLVDETDQLARSVETFHMEGVRFRYYGLRRQLTTRDALPPSAVELLERVGRALSGAGFKID